MNEKLFAASGLYHLESTIFHRSKKGRGGLNFKEMEGEINIPQKFLRKNPPLLPEVSEVDVVRHFTRLSRMNYGVDIGLYPLGSCTMKYNPRVNENLAKLDGFTKIHPFFPEEYVQGALELMFNLERFLCEISGMDAVSLHPAAGAHGEWTGLKIIKKYFEKNKEERKKILIPDTAHGTNPASCTLNEYEVEVIKSSEQGIISPEVVGKVMNENVAALMVTNPNTLGLFEENLDKVSDIIHSKGGLVYGDGANLNALVGKTRIRSFGVDIIHFNLHKTFSTPHGGGGPGSGPIGVIKNLEPYLPVPRIIKDGEKFRLSSDFPHSIGKISAFYGNFLVLVKSYAYIREMGGEGLKKVSEMAVLNSNYLCEKLKKHFHLPYKKPCMHEFVLSDKIQSKNGITTMDIAKRLMDYGFHPSTIYFPLVVHGAMMIEPTETESKEEIDKFIFAMERIADECNNNPEIVKSAPHLTYTKRPDEVRAGRKPVVNEQKKKQNL